MIKSRIMVTGATGKTGSVVVAELPPQALAAAELANRRWLREAWPCQKLEF
jgi:hypothetical protein